MTESRLEFPLFSCLVIRFLIPLLVVDIETHHLRGIDHAYQGLSLFEGKIALRRLRGRYRIDVARMCLYCKGCATPTVLR
jgi:hypothetical protein